MEPSGKRKWNLVAADDLDYETAKKIGIFMDSFSDPDSPRRRVGHSPEYYLWKLIDNPAGRGFTSLALDGTRIVGITDITPKRVWFGGGWIKGSELCDGYVHPDYHRQGIFSSLLEDVCERARAGGIEMIYGTPNEIALPVEVKCGFLPKKNFNLFMWALPLKAGSFLVRYTKRFKIPLPVALIDRTGRAVLKILSSYMSAGCNNEELNFGPEFDELDEKLRRRTSFMLSRDAKELKWRIGDNPDRDLYRLFTRRNRNGVLTGALILKETFQDNMRILFVADYWGISRFHACRLWNAAVKHGIDDNYDMVAALSRRNIDSFFKFLPVLPIPINRKELIFYNIGIGVKALENRGKWRFSIMDTDNI